MTSRKSEIMVGMFVLITIAALLMLSLKVVNQGIQSNGANYTLKAKFDNIGGLKARSAVKVGGVTIGRVESITLDNDDFTPIVILSINQEYSSFPETTSVSILTSGL